MVENTPNIYNVFNVIIIAILITNKIMIFYPKFLSCLDRSSRLNIAIFKAIKSNANKWLR